MKKRIYDVIVEHSLNDFRQMVFLSGPRQVGKTTVASAHADYYLNWDEDDAKALVLAGQQRVADYCGFDLAKAKVPVVAFDEIHKYKRWKQFLKGFFDKYEKKCKVIATGSAKLDVYKKGGDSMIV